MKKYLNEFIIPYKGTEAFQLGMKLMEVRQYLKKEKITFNQSIDPNKGCVPEIPWIYISIEDSITLCFAKDILFEIILENEYTGALPNGITLGRTMGEAENIDPTLEYNDDDEDYVSEEGYWLQDDPETGRVISITVFIPEANNTKEFFSYAWVEKYM